MGRRRRAGPVPPAWSWSPCPGDPGRCTTLDPHGADVVVPGGATRADSVRCGLDAVPDDAAVIVVHDAARPLASPALFAAVIAAVTDGGADGAVPGVPPSDTIKTVDESGRVTGTLDRDRLVAVQTPQAFRAAVLRRAHDGAPVAGATDDAMLVESMGGTVQRRPRRAAATSRSRTPTTSTPPSACWRRGPDEHAHRPGHRRPPLLRGPAPPAGAGRRRDRGRPGPGRRTATPTPCATPWPTRCWAPWAWATWAGTSPTPTPSGRAPTASPC